MLSREVPGHLAKDCIEEEKVLTVVKKVSSGERMPERENEPEINREKF